jgi:hypothetical protein
MPKEMIVSIFYSKLQFSGKKLKVFVLGIDTDLERQDPAEPDFVNLLRSPGIDSQPGGPV